MLTIYRRHRTDCSQRNAAEIRILLEGDLFIRKGTGGRCSCALWVHGFFGGQKLRKPLGTRDWKKAQEQIRVWLSRETQPNLVSEPELKTIADAWTEFLADVRGRKLHDSTVRKYKLLRHQMEEFARMRGLRFLVEFDLSLATQFRSLWKDGPRSSAKKLERLRSFFRFAQEQKWTPENPASKLKSPKFTLCPTLPYTRDEMVRILAAVDQYMQEIPAMESKTRDASAVLFSCFVTAACVSATL
jgi:hypothetical protein